MGFFDDVKDKAEDVKDDAVNKFHEEKGRMEERHDQAEADKDKERERQAQSADDEYEPEEKDV